MDRLSGLPDDVVLRILSFTTTKTAVATSALSPRFRYVWKHMPNLSFYARANNHLALTTFLNNNLTSHLAPVLKQFKIRISGGQYNHHDIVAWLDFVVSLQVEKLRIVSLLLDFQINLPSTIFNSNSIRWLKLEGDSIVVQLPPFASMPSLLFLAIKNVNDLVYESVQQFLNISPALKCFHLEAVDLDDPKEITIFSKSLEELSIQYTLNVVSIQVNTPSLKVLHFTDMNDLGAVETIVSFEKMTNLEQATVNVGFMNIASLIRSIRSSVRKFTICSSVDIDYLPYSSGVMFNNIESLDLCCCASCHVDLYNILRASPNVRLLRLYVMREHDEHDEHDEDDEHALNQTPVPTSTLDNLHFLKCTEYAGWCPHVVKYILKNARSLKKVDIFLREGIEDAEESEMDILSVPLASKGCDLNVIVADEANKSESE